MPKRPLLQKAGRPKQDGPCAHQQRHSTPQVRALPAQALPTTRQDQDQSTTSLSAKRPPPRHTVGAPTLQVSTCIDTPSGSKATQKTC